MSHVFRALIFSVYFSKTMANEKQKPLFRDLTADVIEPEVTEVESLCMNCQANGITKLLFTKIPYYKNVIIMSFSCEECGYGNNEIQPGGAIAQKGVRWRLSVETKADLDRQVVKSDYTSIRIPEVELEIPSQSQKGEVTTVEGLISRTITGLSQDQETRKLENPEAHQEIERYIQKLNALKELESGPFTVELEDISGNCFVENPEIPRADPRCTKTEFTRTKEQDHILGIFTRDEVEQPGAQGSDPSLLTPSDPSEHSYEKISGDEVLSFNTNCPECNAPASTDMKLTNIPYFKEVVIMATTCDACGHRTNEVKSGGGVAPQGVRFEVRIAGKDDFSRDVLKSETCSMSIPELEMEAGSHALSGRFTTTEGLLRAAAEQLAAPAAHDASSPHLREKLNGFVNKLEEVLEGKRAVTLVLDDPAGNSYVQSLAPDPQQLDEGLKIVHYERSFEQKEELGLNDMKTEGYEQGTQ